MPHHALIFAALQPLNLANLINSGIQAAIGLAFAVALFGAAVSLRRPVMWSLGLTWSIFTAISFAQGAVVVVREFGNSDPVAMQAAVLLLAMLFGAVYPATRHVVRTVVDTSAPALPSWKVLAAYGLAAPLAILALTPIFRQLAPEASDPSLVLLPRAVAVAAAMGGAIHAWAAARRTPENRRELQLLAFGFTLLAARAPINAWIAMVTGNGPAFTGLTFTVLANIGSYMLIGAASLMAAMSQERTAYLAQAEALRLSEARRTQGERMESLGRMAAGIAHDFANVLTVIGSSTDLYKNDPTEANRAEFLSEVDTATERATGLTRQLLAFARETPRVTERFVVRERLAGIVPLLNRLVGSDITLDFAHEGDAVTIDLDPSRFDQVVLNLASNARDAMHERGRLSIRTRTAALDAPLITASGTVSPGRYLFLSVEDTGDGIAPEILGHIFEPFFSTKSAGRGTGLGLATVYGIVQQSRGGIIVRSTVGAGTTFELLIPAA